MVCFSAKLPIFRQLKTVINVYDPALSVDIRADEAGQVQCALVPSGDEQSSGGTRVPPDAVRRCTRFCLCTLKYHSLLNVGMPKEIIMLHGLFRGPVAPLRTTVYQKGRGSGSEH